MSSIPKRIGIMWKGQFMPRSLQRHRPPDRFWIKRGKKLNQKEKEAYDRDFKMWRKDMKSKDWRKKLNKWWK